MVLALNMMDEVSGQRRHHPTSTRWRSCWASRWCRIVGGASNEGIAELVDHAVHVARFQATSPMRQDFCDPDDHGGAVHRCLHSIMHLIEDHAERAGDPAAVRRDQAGGGRRRLMLDDAGPRPERAGDRSSTSSAEMEAERGHRPRGRHRRDALQLHRAACAPQPVVKPRREPRACCAAVKIDRILTHGRFTAIPDRSSRIMALVFWLTFGVIGARPAATCWPRASDWLTDLVDGAMAAGLRLNEVLHVLVIDGIFAGVGSVLCIRAHHRDAVLLPVHPGGLGLYGARGLRHGQAAAQDRPVRALLRADAHRLRLQRARASWRRAPCPPSATAR